MTPDQARRGGAPVGHLADLDPVQAAAVLYLRLWCDGAGARTRLCTDLASSLGPAAGQRAADCLDEICTLIARYGRRPFMRHHSSCQCLGADEACFANFIAAASDGDREDAALIATVLVRADLAVCLLGPAEQFGLALKRIALRHARQTAAAYQNTTLH